VAHTEEITKTKTEGEEAIANIKAEHDEQIARFEAEAVERQETHTEEIAKAKTEGEEEIANIKTEYEEQLAKLKVETAEKQKTVTIPKGEKSAVASVSETIQRMTQSPANLPGEQNPALLAKYAKDIKQKKTRLG